MPISEIFNVDLSELLNITRSVFWQALAASDESTMTGLLAKRFVFHASGEEKQDRTDFLGSLHSQDTQLVWRSSYPINLGSIDRVDKQRATIEIFSAVKLPAEAGTKVQPFRAVFELEKSSKGWLIVSLTQGVTEGQ